MKKLAPRSDAPGALELIEEAVNLLRAAPPGAWAIYLAGAVPWVLGLGYFWAATSWFAPKPEEILWRAFGLVLVYLGLKTAQAEFCARLRARRLGVAAAPLAWRGLARTAARQARTQGWAVPVMPVAALLTLPLVAAWSYFECVTALAAGPDPEGDTLEARARREATRWPGPAFVACLLFTGLWLCVWLNIATGFYLLPWLARTLFGLENLFGLSGWWALNSTFFALVTVLTWLAVDPLVKAYHVLRTFYGEARRTGEDLRLELRGPARAARLVAALVVVWLTLAPGVGGLRAAESAEPVAVASPAQVDAALDEALRDRDFRWGLQPLPAVEAVTDEDGWLKRFVRQGFEFVAQLIRDVRDWIKEFVEWLDGLFGGKKEKPAKASVAKGKGMDLAAIARAMLYVLLGLCVIALGWVLWASWRKRPLAPRPLAPLAAAALPPDLNDEKLEASRLPEDEWLALAREQLARGEWRLALRALFLASLAGLGARGLVILARTKTNLDYERELTRRAAARAGVVAGFRARRLAFEQIWYGRAAAEEALARAWLAELEREGGGAT